MSVIERLAQEGPTAEELERARNSHFADFYKSLDNLQSRADLLNHYERLLGDPGGIGQDVERFVRATTTSVREAFAAMASGKRLVMEIVPDESAPLGAAADGDGDGDGESDADGDGDEDDITGTEHRR